MPDHSIMNTPQFVSPSFCGQPPFRLNKNILMIVRKNFRGHLSSCLFFIINKLNIVPFSLTLYFITFYLVLNQGKAGETAGLSFKKTMIMSSHPWPESNVVLADFCGHSMDSLKDNPHIVHKIFRKTDLVSFTKTIMTSSCIFPP